MISFLITFVKIAQWRKPISKIFMTMMNILHVLRFINLHKILVVSSWTKNDTQAEVISCTGTLTLMAVWGQGVMGQMVGDPVCQVLSKFRRTFGIQTSLPRSGHDLQAGLNE